MINLPTDLETARRFLDTLYPEGMPDGMALLIWTKPDKRSSWFTNTRDAAAYAIEKASNFDVYDGGNWEFELQWREDEEYDL